MDVANPIQNDNFQPVSVTDEIRQSYPGEVSVDPGYATDPSLQPQDYTYINYPEFAGTTALMMNPEDGILQEEEPQNPQEALGTFVGNQETIEKLEQTLALIQPEAMAYTDEIVALIRREGLAILKVRRVQLTAEQASQFYQDDYQSPGFSDAVSHLYSGPILALVLSGPNAIDHWLRLIGPASYKERSNQPKCFRARFGTPDSDIKNGLHGSAAEADALRELHFFFPELVVEPIIADNLASYYLNENVHPVLTIGLSKLVRERPTDPVLWLADWLLANNPNKPKEYSRNGCQ